VHPEREDDARRHHNGAGDRNWQQHIEHLYFKGQVRWNKELPDLAPTNPPIPYLFQGTFGSKPLPGNFFPDFPPAVLVALVELVAHESAYNACI
jgi:hypothetical protein